MRSSACSSVFSCSIFSLRVARARDQFFFPLPVRLQRVRFLANLRQFFVDQREPFFRVRIAFFFQRLPLDFQLRGSALELIDIRRQRIDLNAQRGRGLIDQVNGFVGQEAIRNVTMRQSRGRDNCRVLDAHAVMHFVALFQAAQDGDRVFDIGLANENDLEAALQGRIFLNVLAVLVQRGRANRAQFATSQRWLEHVGRVHRTLGRARANQRVQLVDEQDDLSRRIFNLLQHGFQAVFKLAAVFCARQHRTQIQRHHTLVLQPFGHIARDDALRQAFDNGGLAYARLSDQHRIVLGAAGKHLHHTADFFVAADHGIELAATRLLGQIAGIAFQRLVLRFGILVGDFLRSAHRGKRFQNCIVGSAVPRQDFPCGIALEFGCRQQQMLSRNVFVLEVTGFLEGELQQLIHGVGNRRLSRAAGDFRAGSQ